MVRVCFYYQYMPPGHQLHCIMHRNKQNNPPVLLLLCCIGTVPPGHTHTTVHQHSYYGLSTENHMKIIHFTTASRPPLPPLDCSETPPTHQFSTNKKSTALRTGYPFPHTGHVSFSGWKGLSHLFHQV